MQRGTGTRCSCRPRPASRRGPRVCACTASTPCRRPADREGARWPPPAAPGSPRQDVADDERPAAPLGEQVLAKQLHHLHGAEPREPAAGELGLLHGQAQVLREKEEWRGRGEGCWDAPSQPADRPYACKLWIGGQAECSIYTAVAVALAAPTSGLHLRPQHQRAAAPQRSDSSVEAEGRAQQTTAHSSPPAHSLL